VGLFQGGGREGEIESCRRPPEREWKGYVKGSWTENMVTEKEYEG